MKPIKVNIVTNPLNIVKETPEARRERIHAGGTYTRVVPSKKGKGSYNRNDYK